jgi:hypothetical protein
MKPSEDPRIVMTLDAGGTHFRFSAVRRNKTVAGPVRMPSNGGDLDRCLGNIVEGFTRIRKECPESPAAISFAFPGPADYPNGIIGDLGNLPAFRGGVVLGPMLRGRFGIPVYINYEIGIGNKTGNRDAALEDPAQLKSFLEGRTRVITVPGGNGALEYDSLQRVGIGVSRMGTSRAVSVGAYAFALHKLDEESI